MNQEQSLSKEQESFKRLMECNTEEYKVAYKDKDQKTVELGLERLKNFEKPRTYVTWDKLVFDKKHKTLFVILNSNIYILEYCKDDFFKKGKCESFVMLYKIREKNHLVYYREETKQLFDDLKLEVIK